MEEASWPKAGRDAKAKEPSGTGGPRLKVWRFLVGGQRHRQARYMRPHTESCVPGSTCPFATHLFSTPASRESCATTPSTAKNTPPRSFWCYSFPPTVIRPPSIQTFCILHRNCSASSLVIAALSVSCSFFALKSFVSHHLQGNICCLDNRHAHFLLAHLAPTFTSLSLCRPSTTQALCRHNLSHPRSR